MSEKVIDCMINTPNTARPPASATSTIVVDPVVYPNYPYLYYPFYPYPYWGWGWYGGYWGHGHYRR